MKTGKLTQLAQQTFVSLCLCFFSAAAAHAQVPTYTTPQTVQQTLANNTACTGSAQTFPVTNLGQTQHFATAAASGTTTSFQMVIQGQDNSGNVFTISDAGQIGGTVTAAGYFPVVQVQVICLPNTATFTVNYSGASATPITTAGSFFASQIDKEIFQNVNAASTQIATQYAPPFGNAFGELIFHNATTPGTGGSVSIACESAVAVSPFIANYLFPIANSTAVQTFSVSPVECPRAAISYAAGVGAGSTFSLEYLYDQPGTLIAKDPCASQKKQVAPINITATTQMIPGVLNNYIWVCGIQIVPGAADNVALIEGQGALCATSQSLGMAGGTTAATGWNLAINENMTMGSGEATVFKSTFLSNNVCLVVSAASQLSGAIEYVIAP
jgi:hypothetical protein